MSEFVSHHLQVTMRVETPLLLGAHKGAAIRGALLNALRRHYCLAPALTSASRDWQAHVETCPACRLIAAEDPKRERGRNLPRAYVIDPPLEQKTRYEPGEMLSFGLGLFADAAALYPYLLSALSQMGSEGLGHRLRENDSQRGRLALYRVEAFNPLTRERLTLFDQSHPRAASKPALPVTHALVLAESARWPADRLTIRFLTPTRITRRGRLVHSAEFLPLIKRLLERVTALWQAYADAAPEFDQMALLEQAALAEVVDDSTQWADPQSRSARTGRKVPIGGYVGAATYRGALGDLLPWLLWGRCIHVGKNAVKGGGWYELLP